MMTFNVWNRLFEAVSPRFCAVCRRRLSLSEQAVCVSCNLHLPRTLYQYTPRDNPLARLFWGILPVEKAVALFYYEAASAVSNILYDLKYHDSPDLGRAMGQLMAHELTATDFFGDIDVIVPVPLARSRQRQRGYNQSAELAKGLSRVTGLPVSDRVVCRTHFEKSQTQMHYWERQANVANVFEAVDLAALRHRHVLLVDDVVTTGATIAACGREILKAEGARISVLSLGFVKS